MFSEFFAKHLPLIVVDDLSSVTMEMLMEKAMEFQSREYNWDMVRIGYWKSEIQKAKEAACA